MSAFRRNVDMLKISSTVFAALDAACRVSNVGSTAKAWKGMR